MRLTATAPGARSTLGLEVLLRCRRPFSRGSIVDDVASSGYIMPHENCRRP